MKTFFTLFFITLFGFLSRQEAFGQESNPHFRLHKIDSTQYIIKLIENKMFIDNSSDIITYSVKIKLQNSEFINYENELSFTDENMQQFGSNFYFVSDTFNSNFHRHYPYEFYVDETPNLVISFLEDNSASGSPTTGYDYVNIEYLPNGNLYTDTFPSYDLFFNHPAYPKDVYHDESFYQMYGFGGPANAYGGCQYESLSDWEMSKDKYKFILVFRDTTMPYEYIKIRSNIYHPMVDYQVPAGSLLTAPEMTHAERYTGLWISSKLPIYSNSISAQDDGILLDSAFVFSDTIIYDTTTAHTYLSKDIPIKDISTVEYPYIGFMYNESRYVMHDDFKMYGVIHDTVCWGDGFWANNQYYYESGHIEVRDTTPLGTRKMYGVDLVVLEPQYVDTNFAQVCEGESYTYFGQSFSSTGWHTVTFGSDNSPPASYLACDTVHKLFLTVNNIESEIVQNGTNFYLLNPQSGETYQWIDANTGLAISGTTSSSYTPTQNGNYALKITKGLCEEQSNTLEMTGIGMDESGYSLNIFPNPFGDQIHVELQELAKQVNIKCYDSSAQLVFSLSKSNCSSFDVGTKALAKGVYVLELYIDDQFKIKKMIKK